MYDMPVEMAMADYGRAVSPDTSATEAARTLRDDDVSILVVEDDGIEGVVTESDFVAMVAETTDSVSVAQIMSAPPVTASPMTPLPTVVERMQRHGVERVLVIDSEVSPTPRADGKAVDSEEPRSSDSRPAADDDGTYWGYVSTHSVAAHFADSHIDLRQVDATTDTDARTPASIAGD